MESGADAVYTGLREFSARARAKNITLGQLERMLAYAHQRNRRIYVTLNTLIKERELPQLAETLAGLAGLRVDGVIVQDMAVARLVRRHFPSIPLHASTQMTIHNLAGVQLLEQLGFERAVLARELQLNDIAAIAAKTGIELEIFVHGALCFCISGQCHFSSLLGGHSGNRGRCAQPCRRLYTHRGKQGYYFSPNDLSAIELVPALTAAGVASLKIEGRMKSADYVAKVVAAYRLVLDSSRDQLQQALAEAKTLLRESFGRAPTKGFLASPDPADIANPWLRGGTGRFTGEVRQQQQGRIIFETRDPLQIGDRLRLQPKSDQAGQAWTLRELFVNRRPAPACPGGTVVEVVCPFGARPGDALFKVGAAEAFGMSEEAANRKLRSAGPDRLAVRLEVGMEVSGEEHGVAAWTLRITAHLGAAEFTYAFPLGELAPARSSDMAAVLTARFSETGETPFVLESLYAPDFPQLFIPPARLKEIRRELYRRLAEDGPAGERRLIASALAAARTDIDNGVMPACTGAKSEQLILQVEGLEDIRWAFSQRADLVMVALCHAVAHALPRFLPRLKADADRIVWQLPFMTFEQETTRLLELVGLLYRNGFRAFEVTNPAHLVLLEPFEGLTLSAGYRLFTLNSQALAQWQQLGIGRATLYLEDDRTNMEDLLRKSSRLTVIAYGPVEAMVTRIRIKELGGNLPLLSDRGEAYRVRAKDGLTRVTAEAPFSLTGHLRSLRAAGARSFLLDLSGTAPEQRISVLEAFRSDRPLSGSTPFNFDRGLA